jgi:hypothetical protein
MNAGRSVDEIHRLVLALQTAEENACAMPENWQPGAPVIVPPPGHGRGRRGPRRRGLRHGRLVLLDPRALSIGALDLHQGRRGGAGLKAHPE